MSTTHLHVEGSDLRLLREHAPQITESLLERYEERERIERVLGPLPQRATPPKPPQAIAERIGKRYPQPAEGRGRVNLFKLLVAISALGGTTAAGALSFFLLRHFIRS